MCCCGALNSSYLDSSKRTAASKAGNSSSGVGGPARLPIDVHSLKAQVRTCCSLHPTLTALRPRFVRAQERNAHAAHLQAARKLRSQNACPTWATMRCSRRAGGSGGGGGGGGGGGRDGYTSDSDEEGDAMVRAAVQSVAKQQQRQHGGGGGGDGADSGSESSDDQARTGSHTPGRGGSGRKDGRQRKQKRRPLNVWDQAVEEARSEIDPVSLRFRDVAMEDEFMRKENKLVRGPASLAMLMLATAQALECALAAHSLGALDHAGWITGLVATCVLPVLVWRTCSTRRIWPHTALHGLQYISLCGLMMGGTVFLALLEMCRAPLPAGGAPYGRQVIAATVAFTQRLPIGYLSHAMVAQAVLSSAVSLLLYARVTDAVVVVAFWGVLAHFALKANQMRERGNRTTYLLRGAIFRERNRFRVILQQTFPPNVVARLLGGQQVYMTDVPSLSCAFADIKNFTPLSARMSARKLLGLLNLLYKAFDRGIVRCRTIKLDTIGDCLVVCAGVAGTARKHAEAVTLFSIFLIRQLRVLKQRFPALADVDMRIGVHSGPAAAGVADAHKPRFLVWGQTVYIANKMESTGIPGRIQLSAATRRLLPPSYCTFDPHPRIVELRTTKPVQLTGWMVRLPEDDLGAEL